MWAWIRERRLVLCAEAIASPTYAHRNITELAVAWGMTDFSHFSRAFKRRFGVSPRDYRRMALAERVSQIATVLLESAA